MVDTKTIFAYNVIKNTKIVFALKLKKEEKVRSVLKNKRLEKSLTQQQVANVLGITLRMYQYIEAGKAEGKLTHWLQLEKILNTPISKLSGVKEVHQ